MVSAANWLSLAAFPNDAEAAGAVVKVGDGRGFIIEAGHNRLIVTAAHCLPHFPLAAPISYTEERTYADLLGPLGKSVPKVCAECLFADPVGDIAVLGCPDDQALLNEAKAYEMLTEAAPSLRVSAMELPRETKVSARLLTLDGRWAGCTVEHFGGPLWISDAAEPIRGGMSGSPILDIGGAAIGVVCCGRGVVGEAYSEGPNPNLSDMLPGWLLRELGKI